MGSGSMAGTSHKVHLRMHCQLSKSPEYSKLSAGPSCCSCLGGLSKLQVRHTPADKPFGLGHTCIRHVLGLWQSLQRAILRVYQHSHLRVPAVEAVMDGPVTVDDHNPDSWAQVKQFVQVLCRAAVDQDKGLEVLHRWHLLLPLVWANMRGCGYSLTACTTAGNSQACGQPLIVATDAVQRMRPLHVEGVKASVQG